MSPDAQTPKHNVHSVAITPGQCYTVPLSESYVSDDSDKLS